MAQSPPNRPKLSKWYRATQAVHSRRLGQGRIASLSDYAKALNRRHLPEHAYHSKAMYADVIDLSDPV